MDGKSTTRTVNPVQDFSIGAPRIPLLSRAGDALSPRLSMAFRT